MAPTPKMNPARRNARVGPLQLPAKGREGAPPAWPIGENVTLRLELDRAQEIVEELQAREKLTPNEKRKLTSALERVVFLDRKSQLVGEAERAVWRELWATPQAVAWERLGWTRTVARYARLLVAAEELSRDALSEARQLEDRLGLTPRAMRSLLWEVSSDEVGEKRESARGARGRIKAV